MLIELAARGWHRILATFDEPQEKAERSSPGDLGLAPHLRPPTQLLLYRFLGYGNARVLVGADGSLHFEEDLAALTAPPSEPEVEALALAFRGLALEARARGAGFVFLPVPTKLSVRHEAFRGVAVTPGPGLSSPLASALLDRLEAAGVDTFDPAPALRELEIEGGLPYLARDSHWGPEGFDRVALDLARHLRSSYELGPPVPMRRTGVRSQRHGDLARMLGLGASRRTLGILYEPILLQSVEWPDGREYVSQIEDGPVLLLGDSFARMTFAPIRGSGDASFAEQLAYHLGCGVKLRAKNDASSDLEARARWIRDELGPGHRVVVLEIAVRSLHALAAKAIDNRGSEPR